MQSARIFTQDRIALLGQLVRYGITGGLATLVNIGIYHAGIAFLALDPKLAWTLGFLGAVVTGYIVHLDVPGVMASDSMFGLSIAVKQGTDIGFDLLLDQNAPKGPVDVTITLLDAVGGKSASEKKSVTLQ